MTIYTLLRKLAQASRAQNHFVAAKDFSGIRLFKNTIDLSRLQEFYLTHLYNYDAIMRDIILENISEHVLDNELFTDSYLLWKKKNINKTKSEDKPHKDLHLVAGRTIKFNKGKQ